ncbi:glycoside hydrolase family 31 protein [Aureobasidium subglaciale EXF-2481]|uniref:Glycoside hydrolase family 31 protein n=1 Tax=Aureobasidium subglaciale (strain EXF-2481) TaxID=1043005 RepID=A0A074YZF4_AURSE|nr:glycoside hydrolase family 31 protein [Aureobasidium subglaciale EXF-2481]KEQ99527.1 glycoside hydrolase family 31 protein [Aureobasidium subglaciale EXF-2481]
MALRRTVQWLVAAACVTQICASPNGHVPRQNALPLESCPGYKATNVKQTSQGLTADLTLNGPACNTYGQDLQNLKLEATYQTGDRLHVQIYDAEENVYQVPESVLPRPSANGNASSTTSQLIFDVVADPFSFAVSRRDGGQTLFNTSGTNLVFQSQYLRVRTQLPENPHLYGLGEHSDPFQLNTTNYTRTLWSRDAYSIPDDSNLYGNHPVYFDHRGTNGTHGVFLLNSNGMDIKINSTAEAGQYLEYNTIGGIIDLYFLAGPSPTEVSKQYAEIVGLPAEMPYWGFGFHQCRYGYRDVYEVAAVVANYSTADIPLEVMYIDYMDTRHVFTTDPERFPLEKVQELVSTLHDRQQSYIVMVDPAVAYYNYSAFNNGVEANAFLKRSNGSIYQGVVWPGVTAFPDWFASGTQEYWTDEFTSFFNADTGVDIDALWIDMNEASNFCPWPCSDPSGYAATNGFPPAAPEVRANAGYPIPGFPADFQPGPSSRKVKRQSNSTGTHLGLPGRNLVDPSYTINNDAGSLSNKTIDTDLIHENGLTMYDTHNLYGTMMSTASRDAMLARRPTRRPMIITRSTFAGAGAHVGHWLGDNVSGWRWCRVSIAQMLEFAAIFQMPMVGSDVCGFGGNSFPELCARWATLGAFYPFYRNHAELGTVNQEFYRWELTTAAAKKAIETRYRLLDYLYTAFHEQTLSGKPLIQPLFFVYPGDTNTFPIEHQFFWGNSILVSPVVDDNSTSVTFYLPDDIFYDYFTLEPVRGTGDWVTRENVDFTDITAHIRGGSILPLRQNSANTTTELRKQNFVLVIAPDLNGKAEGSLYLDEGDAIEQPETSLITFSYANGTFTMGGSFGYPTDANVVSLTVLGQGINGTTAAFKRDSSVVTDVKRKLITKKLGVPLTGSFVMTLV